MQELALSKKEAKVQANEPYEAALDAAEANESRNGRNSVDGMNDMEM